MAADKNKTADSVEEVNEAELDKISGGSLGNINYTETVDISEDTKSKIK